MSLEEELDIYDEAGIKIGRATRREVHARGLWHQTFHCWVLKHVPSAGWQVLLQLRGHDKTTFPNRFDTSCAGHILAGEAIGEGVRELEEELGLKAQADDLWFCGVVPEVNYISASLTDREYSHVFLLQSQQPLEAYHFQATELDGVFFVSLEDFQGLVERRKQCIEAQGVVLEPETGKRRHQRRELTFEDLAPASAGYFEMLFPQMQAFISSYSGKPKF